MHSNLLHSLIQVKRMVGHLPWRDAQILFTELIQTLGLAHLERHGQSAGLVRPNNVADYCFHYSAWHNPP